MLPENFRKLQNSQSLIKNFGFFHDKIAGITLVLTIK